MNIAKIKSGKARLLKSLLITLIPTSMRDKEIVRIISKWFLLGLIIRLILLPIATHSDLIAVYWRTHFITYHNVLNLSKFMSENYELLMGNISIHYLHSLFLIPLKLLISNSDSLWSHSGNIMQFETNYNLYLQDWFNFISQKNIFEILFLLKLPYLFFDLACAFLFLHILDEEKKGITFFKFWMINPVNIFVTYVFARFDVITIFLIIASLYYVKKGRNLMAAFILGLAITTRDYPFLFLPFFVLLEKKLLRRFFIVILAFFPWSTLDFLSLLTKGQPETWVLLQTIHTNYFLSMKLNIFSADNMYPFIVGYTLISLFVWQKKIFSFELLYKSITLVLLLYYSICFFHPQYFIWLSPFIGLLLCENKKYTSYYVLLILLFFIYSFYWGRALSTYLFASINPGFFWNLPSPAEIISRFYDASKFIGIFRSIFSGICIWIIYNIFRDSYNTRDSNTI